MEKTIGKVIRVFIPEDENDGMYTDLMISNEIGFDVEIDDEEVITIIQEQDEFNTMICREDMVLITKQTISGVEFIDIELYDGDINE